MSFVLVSPPTDAEMPHEMTTYSRELKSYSCPFDDEDANLIIRSSDGLYFRVYRVLLAKASPVFKDMFSIPQQTAPNEVQTVDLTEDGNTLDKLLRLIYPVDEAAGTSLDDLSKIFLACVKYQIRGVLKKASRTLLEHVESEPLRVYAIARMAELDDVARKAAYQCLFQPEVYVSQTDIEELKFAPNSAYKNILRYYQQCGQAIMNTTSPEGRREWMLRPGSQITTYCWIRNSYYETKTAKGHTCQEHPTTILLSDKYKCYERRWWGDFMDQVGHARFDRAILVKRIPILTSTGCAECDKDCARDMVEFVPKLEAKILDAVSEVSLASSCTFVF